jgi:hypothetical protein
MVVSVPCVASTDALQASFLALLPQIHSRVKSYFAGVKCAAKKADCIAESVALCWKWFCRLRQRGQDGTRFIGALAAMAARAVRCGRRLCGQEKAKDVLSWLAQSRHGFTVQALPWTRRSHDFLGEVNGQRLLDALEERLQDNSVTPPPEQAAFRIDFPAWLETLTARQRHIIRAMVLDESTKQLSRRFAVSPGRISQLRRAFQEDWHRFVGDRDQGHAEAVPIAAEKVSRFRV